MSPELSIIDTAESRLARAGFVLPNPAAPVAAYVPAVRMGDTIQTSGQLPLREGQLVRTGRVGIDVDVDEAAELARICTVNALSAIKSLIGSLDEIQQVTRVVGYVASASNFTLQHKVIDGASTLLGEVFGKRGTHARSAVGVANLPLGAPVEVELVPDGFISPTLTAQML